MIGVFMSSKDKSTIQSTILGKAYEYVCLRALENVILGVRPYKIEYNSSFDIAKARFEEISQQEKKEMQLSAQAGINTIIKMEPKILNDGDDLLTLSLQPDSVAEENSDVRDVLVVRRSINWEIGISVKHNHEALKHSRLSMKIDFGEKWLQKKCSMDYFREIKPIFDHLSLLKAQGKKWNDLEDKEGEVYVPLLNAFKKEFMRLNSESNVTGELIKYLLGSNGNDYYKLIHHRNHTTTVMPYNFNGTLNTAGIQGAKPFIIFSKTELPQNIDILDFVKNSRTTLMMVLDQSWIITFRIHNASSKVETSLKFDIQLKSKPESLFYVDVAW